MVANWPKSHLVSNIPEGLAPVSQNECRKLTENNLRRDRSSRNRGPFNFSYISRHYHNFEEWKYDRRRVSYGIWIPTKGGGDGVEGPWHSRIEMKKGLIDDWNITSNMISLELNMEIYTYLAAKWNTDVAKKVMLMWVLSLWFPLSKWKPKNMRPGIHSKHPMFKFYYLQGQIVNREIGYWLEKEGWIGD